MNKQEIRFIDILNMITGVMNKDGKITSLIPVIIEDGIYPYQISHVCLMTKDGNIEIDYYFPNINIWLYELQKMIMFNIENKKNPNEVIIKSIKRNEKDVYEIDDSKEKIMLEEDDIVPKEIVNELNESLWIK